MKHTLFILAILCVHFQYSTPQNTQVWCAYDDFHQQQMQTQPLYPTNFKNSQNQINKYVQKYYNNTQVGFQKQPLILPVVVHIISPPGTPIGTNNNITDLQVAQGLELLNNAFANTGNFYTPNGVDTDIQFCLAIRDPNGQATTGITRHESTLVANPICPPNGTDMENTNDIIAIDYWDCCQYINIYLVTDIYGQNYGCAVAGYATLGLTCDQLNSNTPKSFIIQESQYWTTPSGTKITAHEAGHFLNLYHTFQGECTNNNCLLDGDQVCDTPPDNTTFSQCNANTCNTDALAPAPNPFTNDELDDTQNYMDYTECTPLHFTPGQKLRMHASLQTTQACLLTSQACMPAINWDIKIINKQIVSNNCSNNCPVLLLTNLGINTANTIELNYTLNNQPQNYIWTGVLNSNQTTEITLPCNSTTTGYYTINNLSLTINGNNDLFPNNNNQEINFYIYCFDVCGNNLDDNNNGDIDENCNCTPITVTNDTAICPNSAIQLKVDGGINNNYSWLPIIGLNNPNIANPIATPNYPTTYTVTANTLGANIILNPDFSAGNFGFTSTMFYSPIYSPGNYYVNNTWFSGTYNLLDHTPTDDNMFMTIDGGDPAQTIWQQENIIVKPNTNYQFSFWATEVDFNQPNFEIHFIGNVTPNTIVATLNGIPLTVPNQFIWDQYATPIWNSTNNTLITIQVINLQTNSYGNDFGVDDFSFNNICTVTDSVHITMLADSLIYQQPVTCTQLGKIVVKGINGAPPYKYQINGGAWQNNGNFNNLNPGTYTLTTSDKYNCSVTRTITIENNALDLELTIDKLYQITCDSPAYVIAKATNLGIYPKFELDNTINQTNGNFTNLTAGEHTIIVSDEIGCKDTINFTINPFTSPTCNDNNCATLDTFDINTCKCLFLPITSPTCNDNNCATLDTFDINTCSCLFLPITPISCEDNNPNTIDSYNITTCTCLHTPIPNKQEVLMPSAFTPNNDGINDELKVIANIELLTMKLQIYNRWGQLVFENINQSQGWDGYFKNIPQPIGVYSFILQYKNTNNPLLNKQLKGNITLIR